MKNFFIKTLGCRLNQAESAMMKSDLEHHGMLIVDSVAHADLVLINSCTVTARADNKTLAYARRVKRENPRVRVAIIGCMAQTALEQLKELPYVDFLFGNQEKNSIVAALASNQPQHISTIEPGVSPLSLVVQASGDERVNLKIQDGCDNQCSYCLVTIARGPSRSLEPERVLDAVSQLAHNFDEIVLTGVHIGSYGQDLQPSTTLARLAEQILCIPHLGRLRLSSIDPSELDSQLLELLHHPRLCQHLHISLQSAHDHILQCMNRHYSWDQAIQVLERIKGVCPHIKIGTDIIAGFPGETRPIYNQILARLKDAPLDYMHIFPFSSRPGTQAATLSGHIADFDKHERVQQLQQVSQYQQRRFHTSCLGQERWVILEKPSGYLKGETDNYISVHIKENPDQARKLRVKLLRVSEDGLSMEGERVTEAGC